MTRGHSNAQPVADPSPVGATLPGAGGAFVGRAHEMSALDDLVGTGARLVTLLGFGGVGKTRLAVEWARAAQASKALEDAAVYFCDLSTVRTPDGACSAVARSLGVPLAAGATTEETVSQIGRALADLDRVVLILDNLEQIASLAAELFTPWLTLAPLVQIVATSRERLRLRDEQCLAVEPLAVPPAADATPDTIAESHAVQLFVARTRQVRRDFTLTPAEAPVVAEVVRALEGIPLAIELCAARMGILSASQILPRLSRQLDLLVAGARDAPVRHATLRTALAWSWELSSRAEQAALAQASVFCGDFSIEAAEAVLVLEPGAPAVLDALQSLQEKSLVRVCSLGGGSARYGLLASVRELAHENLVASGGVADAEARHAAFFVGASGTPLGRATDLGRLEADGDDLAAAAERALARRPASPADADVALRALVLLEPLYLGSATGRLEPYAASLDAALALATPPVDPRVVARALYVRALADFLRGRVLACFLGFQRAVEEARSAGARLYEGLSLTKLAMMYEHADQGDEARRCFDEARAIALDLRDPGLDGDIQLVRGGALLWQGRAEDAAVHETAAIEHCERAGDLRGRSMATALLAIARLNQARYDEGRAAAERALAILDDVEEQRTEGYVFGVLGRIHHAEGRLDEARASLAAALRIHRAVGDAWSAGVHLGYLGNLALEERRFGEACERYRAAIDELRGTGERHYAAILLAALGAAELASGVPGAASRFDDAARALVGVSVPATHVNVDLYRAFEDIHAARASVSSGNPSLAEEQRASARARLARALAPAPDGSPSAAQGSEDVRFAARIVARELDVDPALSAALPAGEPARAGTLVVGPGARWFRRGEREPVSLQKGRAARLILAELVRRRIDTPGVALTLDALFEAGWPGERVQRRAAANRVYVTLSKLKSLGLRGLIQSRDDGFLVDPAAVVVEALGGP